MSRLTGGSVTSSGGANITRPEAMTNNVTGESFSPGDVGRIKSESAASFILVF